MMNNSKDSTTTTKVASAIVFIVFTILYLYNFQSDVLAMTQNIWAKGQTIYHREVGTLVIMFVLGMVAIVTSIVTSIPQRAFSLIFFPSFLLLGLLTAVNVDGMNVHTSTPWLIATPLLLIIYGIVVRQLRYYRPFLTPLRSTQFLSHPWWTNFLLLVLMMSLTYAMGNTDRTLHTRLKVERYCQTSQWDKALSIGLPQHDNDSSLTMLRALALAQTSELGEKLFTYDITGNSRSLIPQTDHSVAFMLGTEKILWKTIGIIPRDRHESVEKFLQRELRRGTVSKNAQEYLLCAQLLDKNLPNFAKTLIHYYNIGDSLPRHYAEAYAMYCHKYNIPDTLLPQSTKTDYADFLKESRNYKTQSQKQSALRKTYFGSYWYYYNKE